MYMSNTNNAPAVANGVVYFCCQDDLFYALDAATGSTIWTCNTGSSPHSTPAVVDGTVYVGSGYKGVFAINASTGAKIWNYPTSPGMHSSVAVAGGRVYLAGNDGVMYALDSATGAKLWSYTMSNTGTTSSPAVANAILYIRDNNGYLCAFGKAATPSTSIFPAVGLAGTTTTVSGSGFQATSTLIATFGGAPITLSSSTVDPLGHFSATFTIPPTSVPGNYQITITDTSGNSASTNYTVVAPPSTSWPMFMHNLQHTGTPDNVAPTNNTVLWKFDVDRGEIDNAVTTSAAVVGDIVYEASHNAFLYALDAYSGTLYWRFNLGGIAALSSPAVVDGVVYIGSERGVYALNAYTGTKIWQSSPTFLTDSSPAVSGGTVYIGSFVEHSLFAFRASTGQLLWKFTAGDYINSSPAVAGNVVYVTSDDGYLYALNAATGALVWKFYCLADSPADNLSSSPAIANGVVYVTVGNGNVFALDASNGNKIWSHTTANLQSFTSSPIYANGIVYTSTGSGIYALDANTGNEIWHTTGMFAQASPAIVGNVIYVGCGDGNIYALDALSGNIIWQFATGSFIRGQTSIANGVIYVGTGNGTIWAIGTPVTSPLIPTPMPTPTPTSTPTPLSTPAATASPKASPTPSPTPPSTPNSTISIQATKNDGTKLTLSMDGNITTAQITNTTITTNQTAKTTTISFMLTGQSGNTGFGNITIPKNAVSYGTTPTIYIENQKAEDQGYTQDSDNFYVWYTTSFSTHQISIVFTTISPKPTESTNPSGGIPIELVYGAIYGIAIAAAIIAVISTFLTIKKKRR
jgi:outer membrane protein assembly factor BamB